MGRKKKHPFYVCSVVSRLSSRSSRKVKKSKSQKVTHQFARIGCMSDFFPMLHRQRVKDPDPDQDQNPDKSRINNSERICPICQDDTSIETSGTDIVCLSCGTIIDTPLEEGAEFRWFSYESGSTDQSRCGFPVNHLMPISSLGTIILQNRQSAVMRRVTQHHMWNRGPYREFTLWSIFDTLQVRASNAGIGGAVLEEAKELFAQLTAQSICRGQPQRDAMLAACIWEALKRHGTTRMPRDIAKIFAIDVKQVTKGIKQFQHLFAIRISGEITDTYTNHTKPEKEKEMEKEKETGKETETDEITTARAIKRRAIWQSTVTRITTFDDFIKPYLTNLSIPRTKYNELYELVRSVCAKTDELGIVPENTPPSLTASVIALCCRELNIRIDISDITHVCGISSVTIQKCMKRMDIWKEKLFE